MKTLILRVLTVLVMLSVPLDSQAAGGFRPDQLSAPGPLTDADLIEVEQGGTLPLAGATLGQLRTYLAAAPTLSLSFNPPTPSILATSPLNTIVAQIVPAWSDGSQFTGTVAFGPPNSNDGGCFSIDAHLNLTTSCNLSADANTTQNVTVVATQ